MPSHSHLPLPEKDIMKLFCLDYLVLQKPLLPGLQQQTYRTPLIPKLICPIGTQMPFRHYVYGWLPLYQPKTTGERTECERERIHANLRDVNPFPLCLCTRALAHKSARARRYTCPPLSPFTPGTPTLCPASPLLPTALPFPFVAVPTDTLSAHRPPLFLTGTPTPSHALSLCLSFHSRRHSSS